MCLCRRESQQLGRTKATSSGTIPAEVALARPAPLPPPLPPPGKTPTRGEMSAADYCPTSRASQGSLWIQIPARFRRNVMRVDFGQARVRLDRVDQARRARLGGIVPEGKLRGHRARHVAGYQPLRRAACRESILLNCMYVSGISLFQGLWSGGRGPGQHAMSSGRATCIDRRKAGKGPWLRCSAKDSAPRVACLAGARPHEMLTAH